MITFAYTTTTTTTAVIGYNHLQLISPPRAGIFSGCCCCVRVPPRYRIFCGQTRALAVSHWPAGTCNAPSGGAIKPGGVARPTTTTTTTYVILLAVSGRQKITVSKNVSPQHPVFFFRKISPARNNTHGVVIFTDVFLNFYCYY